MAVDSALCSPLPTARSLLGIVELLRLSTRVFSSPLVRAAARRMVSTRDTLIQHNGFSGQAIFEEPGPVAKRAVLGPELLVQSPAPRVHAEDCDVAYGVAHWFLQASLSALCALTTGLVRWPPWSCIVAAAHWCLDVCIHARAHQWKMIYEINMYDTRNLLIHVRSHQHADESARRETRRPYAQSEVGIQVEDNKDVRACVSARALA